MTSRATLHQCMALAQPGVGARGKAASPGDTLGALAAQRLTNREQSVQGLSPQAPTPCAASHGPAPAASPPDSAGRPCNSSVGRARGPAFVVSLFTNTCVREQVGEKQVGGAGATDRSQVLPAVLALSSLCPRALLLRLSSGCRLSLAAENRADVRAKGL